MNTSTSFAKAPPRSSSPPDTSKVPARESTWLPPSTNRPPVTAVLPLYIFAPSNTTVPVPLFTTPAVPPNAEVTIPLRKSYSLPSIVPPRIVPPESVKTPMRWVVEPRASEPPFIATLPPKDSAPETPSCRLPSLMIVPPVYAFSRASNTVPAPLFTNCPSPSRRASTTPALKSKNCAPSVPCSIVAAPSEPPSTTDPTD